MIINRIKIKNFGIYNGEIDLDFKVQNNKNIILIGGKNGAGKTTILECLKLCLYGHLSLGYKHANDSYFSFIQENFNTYAIAEGRKDAEIFIDFHLDHNGEVNQYKMQRSWKFEDTIKENVQIMKNQNYLDKKEIYEFEDFTRQFLPSSLFDFFFFDGEKIQDSKYSENLEKNLKSEVMTLFNLDLFTLLKKDLESYIKQDNIFLSLSEEERKKELYSQQLDEVSTEEEIKLNEIGKLEAVYNSIQLEIKAKEKEFKLTGGLLSEERDKLQKNITQIENEKEQIRESIKDFVGEDLPILILKGLLEKSINQMQLEESYSAYKEIESKLDLSRIQSAVSLDKQFQGNDEKVIASVVEAIKGILKPSNDVENIKLVHDLSKKEKNYIYSVAAEINQFDRKSIADKFSEITKLTQKSKSLRNKIELNVKNSAFEDLLREISNLNDQALKVLQHRESMELDLETIRERKTEVSKELEKIKLICGQAKKDETIFTMTDKVKNVLNKFTEVQLSKKIQLIEENFFDMFTSLMRKENFVSRVQLNQENFIILLFNKYNVEVPRESLSAGEKQIYVLSLLWSLIKTSNRHVPLVLDTLLGRLDHSHKENIINLFLPYSSKQTIVLSTDTEIDERYYKKIKPYLAQEYLLDYDSQSNKVLVSNQYF